MNDIKKIIGIARNSIDIYGELPSPTRMSLLKSLGDKRNGHFIRSDISLSCAKKTIHTWDESVQKSGFSVALELAEKCIVNPLLYDELEGVKNNMLTQVENILYENDKKNYLPAYAGFSCVSALSTVLYDEPFDFEAKSELEIAPDQWHSAFYSSLVIAGGAVWESDLALNNLARKEFWEWYLDIVIPNSIRKYS